MEKRTERIGICGGTFDPIHNGHLIIAEEVREKFHLDKVLFIPSGMPPHKNLSGVTLPEYRYEMVCRAVSTNSHFEALDIEIKREGYTYTVDTLTALRQLLGEDTKLYYITGADVVLDLMTWKRFEEVFKLCEFIAVLRPGYKSEDFLERIEYLKLNYMAKINIAEASLIEISSTAIRDKVRRGCSVKYLVPENVEQYIAENDLYKV
ncbi:MAG: nicotinate-nucleotide adenylyltransferase [Clostridia bacterium]|nr:nicotinate-nucleotide adenylyltransferase [Clostridia bacterium]